jgi:predicted DNA-binding transcriptional regulator AlpA
MEALGLFPKRIPLNPEGGKFGAKGHVEAEVDEYLAARLAARDEAH